MTDLFQGNWPTPSFQAQPLATAPAQTFDWSRLFANPNTNGMPAGVGGMPQFGSTAVPAAPTNTGIGSWFSNGNNLGAIASGLSALTSMYMGSRQLGIARDALDLQKTAFNTNLNNSIQNYNTSLEDRIRGRTADYDGKENDVQSYLDRNRLTRSG